MSLVFDFVDSIRKQFIKPPLNKKIQKSQKLIENESVFNENVILEWNFKIKETSFFNANVVK